MDFGHWMALTKKKPETSHRLFSPEEICWFAAQLGVNYIMYLDEADKVVFCSRELLKKMGIREGTCQALTLNTIYAKIVNISEMEKIWKHVDQHDEYSGILSITFKTGEKVRAAVGVKKYKKNGTYTGTLVFFIDITMEYNKGELNDILRIRDEMLMSISHEMRTPLNAIYGSAELLALSGGLNDNERSYINNIRQGIQALKTSVENIDDYTASKNKNITVRCEEFTIFSLLDKIRSVIYMKALEKGLNFCIRLDPSIPKKIMGDLEKLSTVLLKLLDNGIEYTKEGLVSLHISCYREEGAVYMLYEVSDTGIGIKKEHQSQLFHGTARFFEKGGNKTFGMGLGLTVCREYIKAMDGDIKCESNYEKGSRFYFALKTITADGTPIAKVLNPESIKVLGVTDKDWRQELLRGMCDSLHVMNVMSIYPEGRISKPEEEYYTHIFIDSDSRAAEEWLEKPLPYGCEKVLILSSGIKYVENMALADRVFYEPFTVNMLSDLFNYWNGDSRQEVEQEGIFETKNVKALVVDDNQVNLMVASNILKQFNIEVDQAESGTMAIQMYYNNAYDIILMDYLMPDMNGVEVTRNIRNHRKSSHNTAVIALSANVTEDITNMFQKAGADGIMSKPLELKELSRQLKKWLPSSKIVKDGDRLIKQKEDRDKICLDVLKIAMGNIKELNWQQALANMRGSVKNYIKVLKACCTNLMEQTACIRGAENLVKLWDIKIYFHSIKGILLNIGALELAQESEWLEYAAQSRDENYIQDHQGLYLAKLDELVEGIKEALTLYQDILSSSTAQEEAEVMNSREFAEKIELLKGYIQRFEFNEINTMLEELISASKGENKKYLEESLEEIQKFCYDEAMEKLNQLKGF